MADDLKIKHVRITTQIETLVVEAALRAVARGDFQLAHNLWIDGFNAEHYWADLDDDPAKQTPDELTEFEGLMQTLDDLLRREAALSGAPYGGIGPLLPVPTPPAPGG